MSAKSFNLFVWVFVAAFCYFGYTLVVVPTAASVGFSLPF